MATSAAASLRNARPTPTRHESFPEYDVPPGLSGPRSVHKHAPPQTQKFPHTRSQLANIAREHRLRDPAASSPSNSTTSPSSGNGALPGLSASNGGAHSATSMTESNGERENEHEHEHHEHDQEEEVRVSSELVRQVASLLDEENEDGLKGLLKKTFEIDDAAVSVLCIIFAHLCRLVLACCPFCSMMRGCPSPIPHS